jgi:hypothetical protein
MVYEGAMKSRLLLVLVVGCVLLPVDCAARRVHDYVFDVTGSVAAEDGSPLEGVELILLVETPVYEGVTPVKTQRLVTNKGAFIFRCLSHSPATKYTVTVRKEGYEPQTLSGTAPPDGHHAIRLKRL